MLHLLEQVEPVLACKLRTVARLPCPSTMAGGAYRYKPARLRMPAAEASGMPTAKHSRTQQSLTAIAVFLVITVSFVRSVAFKRRSRPHAVYGLQFSQYSQTIDLSDQQRHTNPDRL